MVAALNKKGRCWWGGGVALLALGFYLGVWSIKANENSSIVAIKDKSVIVTNDDIVNNKTVEVKKVKVVATYSHREDVFTQGIFFENGVLYESAGKYGLSSLAKLSLKDGTVTRERKLPDNIFAEDITLVNDKLFLLTYRAQKGMVFDGNTLKKLSAFSISGEGWGLTYNGEHLVMSNGTSELQFLTVEDQALVKTMVVKQGGVPVANLNALQFVNNKIYANVWKTDFIAVINAKNGEVEQWLDCRGLVAGMREEALFVGVLNGIAWDNINSHLLITGKYWPKLYAIKVSI